MRYFSTFDQVPKLTTNGFELRQTPKEVWDEVRRIYEAAKGFEHVESDWLVEGESRLLPFYEYSTALEHIMFNNLVGPLTQWCGEEIKYNNTYGIRCYGKGATLKSHKDRIETHHISAIIYVDRGPKWNWPLDIQDHNGKWHRIFFERGDMVFYESAACEHARFVPNPCSYYCNIYTHFSLVNYQYKEQ